MAIISFPLYDALLPKATIATPPEWKSLTPLIGNLTIEHTETIFALILHYYVLEQSGKIPGFVPHQRKDLPIPYGGKVFEGGKGLLYNVNNLPLLLQQVISEFVKSIQPN